MFSFEGNSYKTNWLEIKNIATLFCVVSFVCILALFLLKDKNKKNILLTKIFFLITLFILETGRIIWTVLKSLYFNEPINWWTTINFETCTMMVWFNIIMLIYSFFVKKDNILLSYLLNISFGVGMVGGILTFFYPSFINSSYSIWHFKNLQSIIIHIILIILPIYFIKIKHFKPRLKNFWVIPFAYLCTESIAIFAGVLSSWNFSFWYSCRPFIALGINIPYPYHILLLLIIITSIMFLVYTIFEIFAKTKNNLAFSKLGDFEYTCIAIIVFALINHFLIMNYVKSRLGTLSGLFCIVNIIVALLIILVSYKWLTKKHK